MPSHREIPEDLLLELEEGGGIKPKTQAAKDRHYSAFIEFIRTVGKEEDEIVDISDEDLAMHFRSYFDNNILKKMHPAVPVIPQMPQSLMSHMPHVPQVSQSLMPHMPQQHDMTAQSQHMLRESMMNLPQLNTRGSVEIGQPQGFGELVQQVTKKSMVTPEGRVESTTLSMSSRRNKYPDWKKMAEQQKQ